MWNISAAEAVQLRLDGMKLVHLCVLCVGKPSKWQKLVSHSFTSLLHPKRSVTDGGEFTRRRGGTLLSVRLDSIIRESENKSPLLKHVMAETWLSSRSCWLGGCLHERSWQWGLLTFRSHSTAYLPISLRIPSSHVGARATMRRTSLMIRL